MTCHARHGRCGDEPCAGVPQRAQSRSDGDGDAAGPLPGLGEDDIEQELEAVLHQDGMGKYTKVPSPAALPCPRILLGCPLTTILSLMLGANAGVGSGRPGLGQCGRRRIRLQKEAPETREAGHGKRQCRKRYSVRQNYMHALPADQ
jgi:hypothetical protein